MATRVRAPWWFVVAAVLLLLWDVGGVWSFYEHVAHGPEAMGAVPSDYDRRLYASLPGWYDLVYATGTWSGLLAAAALLLRSRWAVALSALSLAAVIVMFGWMFLATDIVAAKGVWTTYFPAAIVALSVLSLWLARHARARGWIA